MNWALEVIFGNTDGTMLLRGLFVIFLGCIVAWLFSSGRAKNPNRNGIGEISEAENALFIQAMFNQSNEDNNNKDTSKTNGTPKLSNGKKNQKKLKWTFLQFNNFKMTFIV